jgi:two-component system response regulator PilR (NtrC family)
MPRVDEQRHVAEMAQLGLVGRSPSMIALFQWIKKASVAGDLPVLITGETGTGKELVARAIHRLDPNRSHGPFVPVNCIALSSGVADSELFGHRRGSFTGATEDHRGFFRSADRGVLFLDEVADLEMALQGKLLRVLQEGRVHAVGEDREVTVSTRVIAATNKDLRALIAEGRFRLDLYHRLNVLEARLPPLSERRDDIAILVAHFVEMNAALRSKRPPAVQAGFVETLERIALPGNVRQLENLVCRALALTTDDAPLGVEDLPPEILGHPERQAPPTAAGPQPQVTSTASAGHPPGTPAEWSAFLSAQGGSLSSCLDACERLLLQAALDSAHGNQSQAARLLGITARSIYNKLRRHGVSR